MTVVDLFKVSANYSPCKAACYLPVVGHIGATVADLYLDRQLYQVVTDTGELAPQLTNIISLFEVKQHYRKACIANNFIGAALVIVGLVVGFFTAPTWGIVCLGLIGLGAWNVYKFHKHSKYIENSRGASPLAYGGNGCTTDEQKNKLVGKFIELGPIKICYF